MSAGPRTFRGPVAEWTISHVDGIPWDEYPTPPRRHSHRAQTTGRSPEGLAAVLRCPCGATLEVSAVHGVGEWVPASRPRVAPRRGLLEILRGKTYQAAASRH